MESINYNNSRLTILKIFDIKQSLNLNKELYTFAGFKIKIKVYSFQTGGRSTKKIISF